MKTAVILGGNSGMGKATAAALAQKGYRVIIHGRDEQKTKNALEELKTRSGSTNIEAVTGDLSSVAGMKKTAAAIQAKTEVIDVLVLSTGVILSKRVETADGLDMAFATQYLCRYAMTEYLLPQLRKSAAPRIVSVGAPVMKNKNGAVHFDDLALKQKYSMFRSMGQAMFSNHLFVQEFTKRHKDENIVINILHVGIAKTDVGREGNFFLRTIISLFGKTPDAAAKNIIFLADDPSANFSGYFLKKPGHPEARDPIQYDAGTAEKLWNVSKQLVA